MMHRPALTLYFDGRCPFCAAEMWRLKRWDTAARLGFVDISTPDFNPALLNLGADLADLGREVHSQTASGDVLVGIDSLLAAYTLVGRGWLVAPLRLRWLRPVWSALYRGFARNRYRFSRLLGYRAAPCVDGVCAVENPFFRP